MVAIVCDLIDEFKHYEILSERTGICSRWEKKRECKAGWRTEKKTEIEDRVTSKWPQSRRSYQNGTHASISLWTKTYTSVGLLDWLQLLCHLSSQCLQVATGVLLVVDPGEYEDKTKMSKTQGREKKVSKVTMLLKREKSSTGLESLS